jgi:hypothetical protein
MTYFARKTNGIPILSNQPFTATIMSNPIRMDEMDKLCLMVVAGTVSGGSPTMDCKLQYKEPSTGLWCDAVGQTMAQITAAGNFAKDFTNIAGRLVRVVSTYGGTGQFAGTTISAITKS